MTKLLIVEDQSGPREALEYAVKKVCPDVRYDTARCYEDAQKMIQNGYDVVILDHRMPLTNVGDLEDTDFQAFSDSLRNVGYSLIPQIKSHNAQTVVIGTSSLSPSELRSQTAPDYVISKQWGDAERDLDKIMSEMHPT